MTAAPTRTLADPTFLDDRLAHWAAATPDAEAMTYLGRTWTWAEVDERVRRLAGALKELGIGRGDVVSFLDKNHPACVELTMAAASLGAANAIINFRLAGAEIDYAVNDSGATLLLVGSELMPTIDRIRDRLEHVRHVVEVTPDGAEGDAYEALLAGATPTGRDAEVEADDVCLVMYSSGTTGHPKGVALSQASMVAHTLNAHEGWGFDEGDKNMVSMPLFHVGGSSYVLFGIHDGVPSVMTRDPDGASLAGAIMQGANRTFLVPAVLAQVLQSGDDAIAALRAAQDLLLRRGPDAAAPAARGARGVARHRLHPGLRPDRGLRRDHPPDAGGAPRQRAPRAAGQRRSRDPGRRGAGGQPRHPRGRAHRRARRALVPHAAADEGLPEQAGGHRRGDHRGRLVPHGRHGQGRRRRLRLRPGPAQGHDHLRRREHLQPGGRAGPGRAPRGDGGGRHRRTRRAVGGDGQGGRLPEPRRGGDRGGAGRPGAASGWPTSSARARWTCWRHCRATRRARSSSATCVVPTGRAATARSERSARSGESRRVCPD